MLRRQHELWRVTGLRWPPASLRVPGKVVAAGPALGTGGTGPNQRRQSESRTCLHAPQPVRLLWPSDSTPEQPPPAAAPVVGDELSPATPNPTLPTSSFPRDRASASFVLEASKPPFSLLTQQQTQAAVKGLPALPTNTLRVL